jgi:hypothetical protein
MSDIPISGSNACHFRASSGKGWHADVDEGEGALEAEAEAGVRHRAIAAQIALPGVMLFVEQKNPPTVRDLTCSRRFLDLR